jgi:virginiamycin B lyase
MQSRLLAALFLTALAATACGAGSSREQGVAASETTSPRGAGPAAPASLLPPEQLTIVEFPVPAGSGPHDVAPAPDGRVWFTAQRAGALGVLDPRTGASHLIMLGPGSAPHGVIVGPDGAPWVTDGGQNAILRVDPVTEQVRVFPLPPGRPNANLNTATFDKSGRLWFTGQAGVYGRLDTASGKVAVFDAPGGPGPYGITTTPGGDVYYASLAGNHIARIDVETGKATPLRAFSAGQGARRVWSDAQGRLWVSEWNLGKLGLYDPETQHWQEWRLPGARPMAYAVYVDADGIVWLSDFGANAIVRFDPATEKFTSLPLPSPQGSVRQILGRAGEVWAAESAADKLILIKTRS